jgi:hypothetical protein
MFAPMTHDRYPKTADEALAWKSVKWRNAAGWIVVAIIAARYLIHPIANAILVSLGHEQLDVLPELSLTDVAAIIGLPVGGSFADNIAGES